MNINTIIFDLGGVVINLNEQATVNAFTKLSGFSSKKCHYVIQNYYLFKHYETGLIADDMFRQELKYLFNLSSSSSEIDKAWNEMLGEIPKKKIELIGELRKKYKIAILSNTNNIHIQRFNDILQRSTGHASLHELADHVVFSHEIKCRKPDAIIYRRTLDVLKTTGKQCVFLDDKLENLEAAAEFNIETMHIKKSNDFFQVEKYI